MKFNSFLNLFPERILYEDKYFLVVNKPSGIAVQGEKGDTLLTLLKSYIKERDKKPGNVYLGVVHRLDKPVSGCLIISKRSKISKKFSQLFRDKKIIKIYLAVVEGKFHKKEGFYSFFIKWDKIKKKALISWEDSSEFKKGELFLKLIKAEKERSYLLISPIIGKKHLLRAFLSYLKHPIFGDVKYGGRKRILKGKGIMLHALYLEFSHPMTGELLKLNAPLPQYFPRISIDKKTFWEFCNTLKNLVK